MVGLLAIHHLHRYLFGAWALISHAPFAQVTIQDMAGLLAIRHLPGHCLGLVSLVAIRLSQSKQDLGKPRHDFRN
jgi:hypothetical protein